MTSPRSIWTAAPFSNRGNKLCLSDGDAGPRYGTACCHGIQYCVYENTVWKEGVVVVMLVLTPGLHQAEGESRYFALYYRALGPRTVPAGC